MILTDEMVEKAARAMFARGFERLGSSDVPSWGKVSFITQDNYRDTARAALTAVLPDIVGKIREEDFKNF